MECRVISIKKTTAGESLAGAIIALGIAVLLMAALAVTYLWTSRCFASVADVVDLDSNSRGFMDRISRDIRQADRVNSCTSSTLSLRSGTNDILYLWSPDKKWVVRKFGTASSKTVLQNCELMRYEIFQRNLTNGNYDYYPAATATNAKVVQVTMGCSRSILGVSSGGSGFQSAKVVIRKQK